MSIIPEETSKGGIKSSGRGVVLKINKPLSSEPGRKIKIALGMAVFGVL